ncbi:MAG: septum site-determining protein MinD [Bacillales bacterium]|jgi:septum site-determining protein MinD|nr:septum site-determining protein MinD [Bacillales bacterium]
MGKAIVFTSGKGGVGKTTTTANIGVAMALLGKKVCLVDTDIGLRNLDVLMGLDDRVFYDLVNVVEGRCKLEQAIIPDKRIEGKLFLLPAGQTSNKDDVNTEQMKKVVDELKEDYDYVLLDCPAGIEQGFRNAIAGADMAIVVTTPEKTAVRDADRIVGLLRKSSVKERPKLIINKIRSQMIESGGMLEIEEIAERLATDLIGIVGDSDDVIHGSNNGKPVAYLSKNRSANAYRNIARRIMGESVPLQSLVEKKKKGFFTKLFG